MTVNKGQHAVFCHAAGYAYQLIGDGRSLCIHRLGRDDGDISEKWLKSTADYVAEPGNARLRTASIDGVRCTLSENGTSIVLTKGEKTRRFFADESLDEKTLRALFAGAPLKIVGHAKRPDTDRADLILTILCVALLPMLGLCGIVTGLKGLGRFVPMGWVVLPVIWLLRRIRTGKIDDWRPDLSFAVPVISILFLWITPPGPENRLPQLLWSLPVALVVAVLCIAAQGGFRRALILPLLAVLMLYAPGAVLCINDLADTQIVDRPVEIEELSNIYEKGNWYYYITVSDEGLSRVFGVSRDEHQRAGQGAAAVVRTARGLLGITVTDLKLLED